MAESIEGRRIALLVAPQGTEHVEFEASRKALVEAGGEVVVLGLQEGTAKTVDNDLEPAEEVRIDGTIADADASRFDALVVPGGTVGSDTLRKDDGVVRFVRSFFRDERPVGVICHGPWTLVEADVVRGRTLTSYPSLATDVRNAGGDWQDREVVRDGNLVTSRNPDDLPAFTKAVVETIAEVGVRS